MVHGDVRRMLLNMKSLNEGSRALSLYIAMQLDIATYGEGEQQKKAEKLTALMTPLAKAFFTDMGFENTVLGQQIFGGHGFIREWGQEQLVRDSRIAQIYEGTNGIQAMDLLARKVAGSKGEFMQLFIDDVSLFIEENTNAGIDEFLVPLAKAIDDLSHITNHILTEAEKNVELLGTAANDYLHVFGYTAMAFVWAKMAKVSKEDLHNDEAFHQSKLHTARYFYEKLLPKRLSLIETIKAGPESLFSLSEDMF